MGKHKARRTAVTRTKPEVIIRSIIAGYLITLLMLLLIAFLLYKLELSQTYISVGIIITYILATFAAGWIAGRNIQQKSWMWGLFAGVIYFVILILISLIVNKSMSSFSELFTTLLMCTGGGMLGGMLS